MGPHSKPYIKFIGIDFDEVMLSKKTITVFMEIYFNAKTTKKTLSDDLNLAIQNQQLSTVQSWLWLGLGLVISLTDLELSYMQENTGTFGDSTLRTK